jgi:hypothetical protein
MFDIGGGIAVSACTFLANSAAAWQNGGMKTIDFDELPDRPKKSALQKLQDDMERQLAPMRQIRELQEMIERASPSYHLKKLMAQYEPFHELQNLMRRSAIPKQIQDILDNTSAINHAQRLVDQLVPKQSYLAGLHPDAMRRASGLHGVTQAIKRQEEMMRPVIQHQEWLERLQRQSFGGLSAADFARHLDAANPAIRAMESARLSLDRVLGQFREIDLDQFEPDEGDEEEAQEVVNSIAQTAVYQATFQEAVDRIIAAIEKEKKPSVRLMLWLVFRKVMDWVIAAAIGTVFSYYQPLVLGEPPQAAKKAINETARAAVASPELLAEYRYVSAKLLIVHQNPRALSPEVARLAFGKPVKLLKKDKDFALVVWMDQESGAEVQGWVFARYLSKFR